MRDKRKATRRRTLESGTIILGKKAHLNCTVRDLSELGARLDVQGKFAIPAIFQFIMTGLPLRICKVAWRTDRQIGVEFVPAKSEFDK